MHIPLFCNCVGTLYSDVIITPPCNFVLFKKASSPDCCTTWSLSGSPHVGLRVAPLVLAPQVPQLTSWIPTPQPCITWRILYVRPGHSLFFSRFALRSFFIRIAIALSLILPIFRFTHRSIAL